MALERRTAGIRRFAVRTAAIGLAVAAVLLAQVLYFAAVIRRGEARGNEEPALVLVFDGDSTRIPAGFREAEQVGCRRVVVSSKRSRSVVGRMQKGQKRFRGSLTVVGGAVTTDQDARYTMPVVRSMMEGSCCQRVLFITSWYHLPRAYFLTRLYAIGSGLTWDYVAADPVPVGWCKRRELWAEFPKFWGSLFRVALAAVGIENWPRPSGYPKLR